MPMRRLSAGAGYTYLLRHTTRGDLARDASTLLTDVRRRQRRLQARLVCRRHRTGNRVVEDAGHPRCIALLPETLPETLPDALRGTRSAVSRGQLHRSRLPRWPHERRADAAEPHWWPGRLVTAAASASHARTGSRSRPWGCVSRVRGRHPRGRASGHGSLPAGPCRRTCGQAIFVPASPRTMRTAASTAPTPSPSGREKSTSVPSDMLRSGPSVASNVATEGPCKCVSTSCS